LRDHRSPEGNPMWIVKAKSSFFGFQRACPIEAINFGRFSLTHFLILILFGVLNKRVIQVPIED
jgi:hypothetical protein